MARVIRVLVVGPRHPSPNSRGGMATVVGLMREQRDPRVALTLVATYVDDSPAVRLRTALTGLGRATLLIATRRVDVLHVHLAHRGSVVRKSLPLVVARACGVPAVIHAHSYDFAGWFDTLPRWARTVVRRALPADCWLVLGEGLVKPYQDRLALPDTSIRALLNPAPPVRPRPAPRGATPRAVRAVGLGRMGQRKGTYDLLAALDLLGEEARTGLQVVLAGDGEVDEVRAETARLGLGDLVEVRTWLASPERDALLDSAQVFLLPSHAEGLPMAMLEAMAAGLVPVVSAVGAVGEIARDDDNAVLVAPSDPAGLARAIESLVLDPARLARLADGARETAGALTVAAWFEDLVEVWTQVLAEGGRSAVSRATPPPR